MKDKLKNKPINLSVPHDEGQLRMMFTSGGAREGAGRKGIGQTRKVSLTLPESTWLAIENQSTQRGCSRSEVLRDIIEIYMNHTEGQAETRAKD
ncbi:hypothetical protein Back11_50960 [Paenibacillus baekrokdamisoli]|uniref:Uncharacterized protein n=1 Tax=Paenibacillus baekrokdamisoli TaxID=1712516 RepID=A0A3G9JCR1_9BACL|nr:CopG family transcriptional regulator [Paenibacillus baekrokdamisoli]MBB3068929.1 hypothetical protein [Paenibacillus baekrokdamisoli]BBH23751.1 hypothetical protein Back11_50960 [Paenibacillus baekrokdamisoli]